jgi:hypothetical protein
MTLHNVGQIPAQSLEGVSIWPPASFWSFKSFWSLMEKTTSRTQVTKTTNPELKMVSSAPRGSQGWRQLNRPFATMR